MENEEVEVMVVKVDQDGIVRGRCHVVDKEDVSGAPRGLWVDYSAP